MKINYMFLSLFLVTNSIVAAESDTIQTVNNGIQSGKNYTKEYSEQLGDYYKNVNTTNKLVIDGSSQEIKDLEKNLGMDVPINIKNDQAGQVQGSYSLVNENCEPEFNMDGAFKDMMDKYMQAFKRALDPAYWQQYLQNQELNAARATYSYSMCLAELAKKNGMETSKLAGMVSDCFADKTKGTIETKTGTQVGTENAAETSTKIDAGSLGFAGQCVSNMQNIQDGDKFAACIEEKNKEFNDFLNGSISNALNFGMADFALQQQKCQLDNQNKQNELKANKHAGAKNVTNENCPIGTRCSGVCIKEYGPDGPIYESCPPESPSSSGGNYKSGSNLNKIHVNEDDWEATAAVLKSVVKDCAANVGNISIPKSNHPDFRTAIITKAIIYNWCDYVFTDMFKKGISTHVDLDYEYIVPNGRWEFPQIGPKYLTPEQTPELKYAQNKVSIYEECLSIATSSDPLTIYEPEIVAENGKLNDQYKEVSFDSEQTSSSVKIRKNRYDYFLRNAKSAPGYTEASFKSLPGGGVPFDKKYDVVPKYKGEAENIMRTMCLKWAGQTKTNLKNIKNKMKQVYDENNKAISFEQTEKTSTDISSDEVRYNEYLDGLMGELTGLEYSLNRGIAVYEQTKKDQENVSTTGITAPGR